MTDCDCDAVDWTQQGVWGRAPTLCPAGPWAPAAPAWPRSPYRETTIKMGINNHRDIIVTCDTLM